MPEKNILYSLSNNTLKKLIGHSYLNELSKICFASGDLDKSFLVACLYSKYLGNPFQYESVRRAVLETLPENITRILAEKYRGQSLHTHEDNALSLSILKWNKTNYSFISELLSYIDIPKNELLTMSRSVSTKELIEPVEELHDLFHYQKELVEIILSNLNNNKKFLVQLPTGAGKTRVIIEALVCYINDKNFNGNNILWLAHSEELLEQAIETCEKIWIHKGASTLSLVRMWGNYKPTVFDLYEAFIFASLQKVVSLSRNDNDVYAFIKKHVDIIVFDEAHKALAPTYKSILEDLSSDAIVIGLSATPGRGRDDIENKKLSRLFNQKLITPSFPDNPITYLKQKGVLADIKVEFINTGINVNLTSTEIYKEDFALEKSRKVISFLAKNRKRNKQIIELVEKEVKNGSPCIIFSCSIEHSSFLAGAFALSGYKAMHINGNMPKGIRRKIIDSFNKNEFDILINYGILSTGFDSPRIKTVIITRPTNSVVLYSQMIGRGLRGSAIGGTAECKIIDLKDNFLNYGKLEDVYNYFNDYWVRTK